MSNKVLLPIDLAGWCSCCTLVVGLVGRQTPSAFLIPVSLLYWTQCNKQIYKQTNNLAKLPWHTFPLFSETAPRIMLMVPCTKCPKSGPNNHDDGATYIKYPLCDQSIQGVLPALHRMGTHLPYIYYREEYVWDEDVRLRFFIGPR